MEKMKVYRFEVETVDNKEKIILKGFVVAANYVKAVEKINSNIATIVKLNIYELVDWDGSREKSDYIISERRKK